ncbi:uncharacterized protein MKZ38_000424 [Zalerion maritima]|uniref:Large ribosomal subunit protein mL67 n=1 Tax=Zalerion maritima TaxID=339359 RepID=A0AAD5RXW7_9PEZI|nr:uncharacterized protein MKZ38_000424 [Zalerion maritima]
MTNPLRPLSAFSQLSIGVSRTSIRLGSTRRRWKRPRPDLTGFEPGWGEKIWIWREMHTNHVVYSHGEQMKVHAIHASKALDQLPFIFKKTKPSKLRKDYWQKMALIDFGSGKDVVGRSVFQKLRELRHLHEVSWGNEMFFTANGQRTKRERAWALCDQHANTVADMACVLSGVGPSNKMAVNMNEDGTKELLPVKVFWENDLDREYAEEWSDNVEHRFLSEIEKIRKRRDRKERKEKKKKKGLAGAASEVEPEQTHAELVV